MATPLELGSPGPAELDFILSENELDFQQVSSDDEDQNSSDVQEKHDVHEVNTPSTANPEGLPVADSSTYYRIPPNTAGMNPTAESKYACSLLEHRSCLATFHKHWQLQEHFTHAHGMYVPPPRRGNPRRALKPRPRSKPREDNLLKQKLRNGGDFELKWWRKKTSRMKGFIIKVLTKWHVDGVQAESNPELKMVTNPPSLARLLIRCPQTALPFPADDRPLEKQIVDEDRWVMWEMALQSFASTNEGRIALNNVVERCRMDLDQIKEEEERELVRRACSVLETAFPLDLPPPPRSATSDGGRADPIAGGGVGSASGLPMESLQDAHRMNIINAAKEWMGRWRQYLLAVRSRVDKDKWVGEKSIEMYRTWRRGMLPIEDYETCKMLSWRFWTPARQKKYSEHFSEALRGFPDSQDLCSSEEEPPLELEDFIFKKVGTNNLPKFDHKQYLKRRQAKKAARMARRETGDDVPEPRRPRASDGDPQQPASSFRYNTALPWVGDSEQETDIGYVSCEGHKPTQLSEMNATGRSLTLRSGRKRKHVSSRSRTSIDDEDLMGDQQTVMGPNQQSVQQPLGQPLRATAPPRLIPGGMTAEQLALLEQLQEMRNTELEMARELEEQEIQQRATGFDQMRRALRRADADHEEYVLKENQSPKMAPKMRAPKRKVNIGSGEARDSDIKRDPGDSEFL